MRNAPGGINVRRHSRIGIVSFALILAGLVALACASIGSARAKPKCFGQTATIVGTNGPNHISGTGGKDVIVALGGNDTVEAKSGKANHGNDIICLGGGNDYVKGSPDGEKISGGPGNDEIESGNGNDLVVGDNANVSGSESGPTGKDHLDTAGGTDFVVGDNYATGNVSGASPGEFITTSTGPDTVIGDDASVGSGNATGHADDLHLAGASGNDRIVGDSYTVSGVASGGGDDPQVDGGPGADLQVGDGYTVRGSAVGAGKDGVHGADGGDFDVTCRPANTCADVFYGDSYRAACAAGPSVAANARVDVIRCENENTHGGAADLLTPDQGDDFMNGGLPEPDGSGPNVDRCDGGTGHDTATSCKGIKSGFETTLPFPGA